MIFVPRSQDRRHDRCYRSTTDISVGYHQKWPRLSISSILSWIGTFAIRAVKTLFEEHIGDEQLLLADAVPELGRGDGKCKGQGC